MVHSLGEGSTNRVFSVRERETLGEKRWESERPIDCIDSVLCVFFDDVCVVSADAASAHRERISSLFTSLSHEEEKLYPSLLYYIYHHKICACVCVVVVDSGVKTIHNVFLSFSSSISPKSARVCVCVVVVDSEWCVQTTHKSSSFLYTIYEMVHQTGVSSFLSGCPFRVYTISYFADAEKKFRQNFGRIPNNKIQISQCCRNQNLPILNFLKLNFEYDTRE